MNMIKKFSDLFMRYKPYVVLTLAPLLFVLLFGGAMSPVYNTDLPVMVYDMDASPASRQVVEQLERYPYLDLRETALSLDEVEQQFLYGNIIGAIIIPEGFGDDLHAKRGADLLVMLDSCNFMNMTSVMTATSTVGGTLNAALRLQLLEAGGQQPGVAMDNVTTLSVVDRGLYNPTYGYIYFLFPVLLAIFVQQSWLAGVSPYLIEKKAELARAPLSAKSFARIAGQMGIFLVFTVIGLMIWSLTLSGLFNYPFKGSAWLILLVHLPFVLAMAGMALVITSIFDDPVHCTQFNMFLTIPTLLSCGYAWPVYLMPEPFRAVITHIWPLYYYANPMRDIILKGCGVEQVMPYAAGCLKFAAFWLPAGIIAYAWKVRKLRRLAEV